MGRLWILDHRQSGFKEELPFGKLDKAILVYDVGQLVVWWYCTISGFSAPLHANWVNPIQWFTPISYAFFILARNQTRTRDFLSRRYLEIPGRFLARTELSPNSRVLACTSLAAANYITGLVYIFRRFTGDLGSGSYIPLDPFPQLPASTTSTCRDLLHNPASLLYSDPNWLSGRLTQAFVAGSAVFLVGGWALFLILFECMSLVVSFLRKFVPSAGMANIKREAAYITYGWGIALQAVVLIWLSVIATRGVPLMLHEGCGVVVISMSPARGYYDSELHYEGLRLQAVREAFGVCKSLFVRTEYLPRANCTSQRRLYIISPWSVCIGWWSMLSSPEIFSKFLFEM
jgi:hypothetical protein